VNDGTIGAVDQRSNGERYPPGRPRYSSRCAVASDVAITLTYRDAAGHLGNESLYRNREPNLKIATVGLPWSFDGDGTLLRLFSNVLLLPLDNVKALSSHHNLLCHFL
jgi:hypothetical protein